MFVVNEDKSIYVTRGDIVFFSVSAEDEGKPYKFQVGDVVRIKVYGKKAAEDVVLQKDFPVTEITEEVEIYLTEADTKIGEVISKPKDYWYEVELNPYDNPQTIIGYDEDGAKVFKLFPEGDDVPEFVVEPEDIPVVDEELDMASSRPVQNQAIARAFANLEDGYQRTHAAVAALHVTPQMLGANADGETEFGTVLQDYIDSAEDETINIYFPPGEYLWNEKVVTNKTLNLVGERGLSVIKNEGNNACLLTSGCCRIVGLRFETHSASRDEFTIHAVGGSKFFCYDSEFACANGSVNGLHIENVVFSHIDSCLFEHSQISLKTWDCKITNTWVWALSRPYGIGIHGGSGNINLSNVDVVPPLRGDDSKAAIWVNSEGGSETNNIIMENIFVDGNPDIETGAGILCENVFCVNISSFRATCMSECPITIDGCYDVSVSKGAFYRNNKSNLGVNEILVRRTVGAKHGYITIADNHFVNYSADITNRVPAIKVEEGADENVIIVRNMVGQDGELHAYGNICIETPEMRDLSTNIVTGRQYKLRGSFTISAGSEGVSLMLEQDMAKNPTQENFRFWVLNGYLPSIRVQEIAANSVWIGVADALEADVTVYYEASI